MSEKKKAIIIISLILVMLSAAFMAREVNNHNKEMVQAIAVEENKLRSLVTSIEKFLMGPYRNRIINLLKNNGEIVKAFAERDRELLYQYALPKYKALQRENPFFYVMQFHQPNGITFLRMHIPGFFDDDLSTIRPIINAVNSTEKQLSGFEVGACGSYYRVVQPVFYQGEYVGAIEFGIEVMQILAELQEKVNGPSALYFSADNWEKDTLCEKAQGVSYGNYVLVTNDDQVFPFLPDNFVFEDQQSISIADRSFVVHIKPIFHDFQGNPTGGMLILRDISLAIEQHRDFIIYSLGWSGILLIIAALFLYFTIGKLVGSLEKEVVERQRVQAIQAEQVKLLALSAEIGQALTTQKDLQEMLQKCCSIINAQLEAAFTRIWLLNEEEDILELQASAGLYTHLDGPHSRLFFDRHNMVGFVARERKPHLTNAVIGDKLVDDQEWAKREGMVAFAGHPLMVGENLEGVMALFSRTPLSPIAIEALASVADEIALGIEQRKVQEALRKERDFNQSLLNASPIFYVAIDKHGNTMMMNQSMLKTLGYSKEEVVGKPYIPTFVSIEERDQLAEFFRTMTERHVQIKNESHIVTKDNRKLLVEWHCEPIVKSDGIIEFFFGMGIDVSEQRQAEKDKTRLEVQLRQAQKLESIGTLAGGIAHDFNNILTAIIGNIELALMNTEEGTGEKKYLYRIQAASRRAADLVKQILAFSRQRGIERQPMQVKLIAKEALKLLHASLPATIRIQEEIFSDSLIWADPTSIHQVFMNLCTNAFHSMRDTGGVLGVSITDVVLDEDFVVHHPEISAGHFLLVSFTDSGHGMTAEAQERLFDPFYTTKAEGEGTGMGLSVVHGIVHDCGGIITVASSLQKGTTFSVYFPVVQDQESRQVVAEEVIPPGTEHILFVDDEESLAVIMSEIFESLGYVVKTANCSKEALEIFQQNPKEFDLVITDLTMPDIVGTKMAEKMLAIRPDLPVILISGSIEYILEQDLESIGITDFAVKPLGIRDFALQIRTVLDGRSG